MAASRPQSLEEMLAETRVAHDFAENTITVPAHQASALHFRIPLEQGASFEGTYTVSGGTGNDVAVALLDANNRVLVNNGRVSRSGQISTKLNRGDYTLLFDNRFSMFTAKSIAPDFKLVFYR